MDAGGCALTVEVSADHTVRAALVGELDAASSAAIRARLLEAMEQGTRLVIDLASLTFLDSSGLGVLVSALVHAKSVGGRVELENPTPRVRRLLETTNLSERFGLPAPPAAVVPAADAIGGDPEPLPTADDVDTLRRVRTLLEGYENLLRWGDLTPEQVTLALRRGAVADDGSDLGLAAEVREVLRRLGVIPPPPALDD